MSQRLESNENAVYEFRKESFTNMHEVERILIKKNDLMKRAFTDLCAQLKLHNPLMMP